MTMPRSSASERTGSRRDGFLLAETLATFTISAFVLVGLVSASSVLLHSVDRSVAYAQNVEDLSRTMAAIDRDVSGLTRARWNGDEPQAFVFRGGPNSLFFAKADRQPDGTGATSVIALREIVAGSTARLARSEANLSPRATGFADLRFGTPRELGTGVARLRFSYIAMDNGKAKRANLRQWPMSSRLPAAVVIEAVDTTTGRLLASTRVSIHTNADIGCVAEDRDRAQTSSTQQDRPTPPQDPPGTATTDRKANADGSAKVDSEKFCGRDDSEKNAKAPDQPAPRSQMATDLGR